MVDAFDHLRADARAAGQTEPTILSTLAGGCLVCAVMTLIPFVICVLQALGDR